MGKYDKYKESAFTHEEMQPMIIETDMTDIVERLRIGRETCGVDMCRIREAKSGCTCAEAADEIERLRDALREIAKTDVQTWAKAALEKRDWAIVERISEVDQQGIACRALAGGAARAALGEDK